MKDDPQNVLLVSLYSNLQTTSLLSFEQRQRLLLPFDVDVTGLLSSQEVGVLQNHILCVPDDDTQLVPEHTHLGVSCCLQEKYCFINIRSSV